MSFPLGATLLDREGATGFNCSTTSLWECGIHLPCMTLDSISGTLLKQCQSSAGCDPKGKHPQNKKHSLNVTGEAQLLIWGIRKTLALSSLSLSALSVADPALPLPESHNQHLRLLLFQPLLCFDFLIPRCWLVTDSKLRKNRNAFFTYW